MRVAVVQVATSFDLEENRRLVADHVGAAASDGASLVVFPEATMCTFGGPSFDLAAVAEPLDGPFVEAVRASAGRHRVTVVAGMFERAGAPGRTSDARWGAARHSGTLPYNTVVAAGPDGALLGAYRKLHLFDALGARESARLAPGDPATGVVTFGVGVVGGEGGLGGEGGGVGVGVGVGEGEMTAGLLTCYDLRFPEMARALVDRGATLLVLPAHWYAGPGKREVWETLVRARAIESTAYVVAAGKPAPDGVGRSMIVDPAGEICAVLGEDGDGVATADIDAARVAEVRAALPVLEHRRFDVVARPTVAAAPRSLPWPVGAPEGRP